MIEFDPRLHPRDRKGEFLKALSKLKPESHPYKGGEESTLKMPGGITVTRGGGSALGLSTYRLQHPVGGAHWEYGPHATAQAALDSSARLAHPDALGGERHFQSAAHFQMHERKVQGYLPKPPALTAQGAPDVSQPYIDARFPTKPFALTRKMGGDQMSTTERFAQPEDAVKRYEELTGSKPAPKLPAGHVGKTVQMKPAGGDYSVTTPWPGVVRQDHGGGDVTVAWKHGGETRTNMDLLDTIANPRV